MRNDSISLRSKTKGVVQGNREGFKTNLRGKEKKKEAICTRRISETGRKRRGPRSRVYSSERGEGGNVSNFLSLG